MVIWQEEIRHGSFCSAGRRRGEKAYAGSGGALIVLIGINLMGLKKIKTANYLPAVLFSALFVLCEPFVRGLFGL